MLAAKKIRMTAMPEMVSMFNGMGGACAALISIVEFNHLMKNLHWTVYPPLSSLGSNRIEAIPGGELLIILAGLIIGSVSFAGSMIAWAKLNGSIKDFSFRGQHIVNMILLAAAFALSALIIYKTQSISLGSDPSASDLVNLQFFTAFPKLLF